MLTQTLHRKTLKLLLKSKIFFACGGHKRRFAREIIAKLCDDNSNAGELWNSFIQKWLDNNDILTYCTHNEGKSIFAERFIRILKGRLKYTKNDRLTITNLILVI